MPGQSCRRSAPTIIAALLPFSGQGVDITSRKLIPCTRDRLPDTSPVLSQARYCQAALCSLPLQLCSAAAVLCSCGGALPDAHAHTPGATAIARQHAPPAVIEAEKACPRHASGLRYIRATSLGTSALTAARSEPSSRGRVRARRTPTAELILTQAEADRPDLAESCSSGGHRAITWISP